MASKEVAAAQQRLADARAQEAALERQIAEMGEARERPLARLAGIRKRLSRTKVVLFLAGEVRHGTLDSLAPESYGVRGFVDKKAKELREAIASGGLKVNTGGWGASYTAKGLASRVRIPEPAAMKAWDRAIAARARAETALAKARDAEKAAAQAAFDSGEKLGLERIVDELFAKATAIVALEKVPDRAGQLRFNLERLRDEDWGEIADAEAHLAWAKAKNPDKGVCPCRVDQRLRQEAIQLRERLERIAQLPRQLHVCPTHQKRERMGVERKRAVISGPPIELPDGAGVIHHGDEVPHAYCLTTGASWIITSQVATERKAAAAAAAKARRIEFVCPNPDCLETVVATVAGKGQDATVECGVCGYDWLVDAVKVTRKNVPADVPVAASEEEDEAA